MHKALPCSPYNAAATPYDLYAQAPTDDRGMLRPEPPHSKVPRSAPHLPAKTLRLLRGVLPGQPSSPAAGRSPLTSQPHSGSDCGASGFVVSPSGTGQQAHDGLTHGRLTALRQEADADALGGTERLNTPSSAPSLATDGGARSPMPPSVAAALEVSTARRERAVRMSAKCAMRDVHMGCSHRSLMRAPACVCWITWWVHRQCCDCDEL